MDWSPRVKPIKIRRLYRYARLGIYDDLLLHDVGWELYARCADIVTVADVYREGRVPCPKCSTKITRRIDPLFRAGEGGTRDPWFRCTHCDSRLLWRDCRQFLTKILDVPGLKPNEWQHVAGLWDGKEMRVYIDGEEKGALPFKE